MRVDCPDCDGLRRERAAQVRTGKGDLGDLLIRVALHEATAHRKPSESGVTHSPRNVRLNRKKKEK